MLICTLSHCGTHGVIPVLHLHHVVASVQSEFKSQICLSHSAKKNEILSTLLPCNLVNERTFVVVFPPP
jgi:hypothetical protein